MALQQLAQELLGARGPQPIDPFQTQFVTQEGRQWAVNPRTGKLEQVMAVAGTPFYNGESWEVGNDGQLYFASEAPQGATPVLEEDGGLDNDFARIAKPAIAGGLAVLGGLGGIEALGPGAAAGGVAPIEAGVGSSVAELAGAGEAAAGATAAGGAAAATTGATAPIQVASIPSATMTDVAPGLIESAANAAVAAPTAAMPAAVPMTASELAAGGLAATAPGVFETAAPLAMSAPSAFTGTGINIPGVGELPWGVAGSLASGALGLYGANQMSNAYEDMAAREDARIREMMGYGAPYRDQLAQLYADPNAFLQSDRVQIPTQMGTDALARSLSMTQGNPALSGTALHELQNYASNQLFSRYGEEADRLAGFGGLTQYAGGAARGPDLGPASNAINATGGAYNVIGSTIADLTRPPRSSTVNLRLV